MYSLTGTSRIMWLTQANSLELQVPQSPQNLAQYSNRWQPVCAFVMINQIFWLSFAFYHFCSLILSSITNTIDQSTILYSESSAPKPDIGLIVKLLIFHSHAFHRGQTRCCCCQTYTSCRKTHNCRCQTRARLLHRLNSSISFSHYKSNQSCYQTSGLKRNNKP